MVLPYWTKLLALESEEERVWTGHGRRKLPLFFLRHLKDTRTGVCSSIYNQKKLTSPRESAVEASRRRKRGTTRERAADSRGRSVSRGVIVVQGGGDATVTPFPEARHKPAAAAVGDRGLVVSDNDRSLGEQRIPSPLPAAGVAVDGSARKPAAEARKEAEYSERALNDEEHTLGLENGAAAEGSVIVSANAAADAAALAASDRNANGWFQLDGLIDNITEGRPLTRREKEGLERRALAAKSLASSNPRVNGWRRNARWASPVARRLCHGILVPQRCVLWNGLREQPIRSLTNSHPLCFPVIPHYGQPSELRVIAL